MKIIVVSGPSGSGKTTIKNHLQSQIKQLSFSISATTRPKRNNENDGIDYYFLSILDFEEKIKQEKFIEFEEVYANTFYGTLWSEISRINASGLIPILDIDVLGALNIKKKFQDKALTLFIHPGSIEAINKRLLLRQTETTENMLKRVDKASYELSFANQFDHVIMNNNDIEDTFSKAMGLVNQFINL